MKLLYGNAAIMIAWLTGTEQTADRSFRIDQRYMRFYVKPAGQWQAVATQLALPLRILGPDEYRAELVAMKTHYETLWAQHPWRE